MMGQQGCGGKRVESERGREGRTRGARDGRMRRRKGGVYGSDPARSGDLESQAASMDDKLPVAPGVEYRIMQSLRGRQ